MHRWDIQTTQEFDKWFELLGKEPNGQAAQIALASKIELLKTWGPFLSRPHADTLKGSKHANMKELRSATADTVIRVAFAFDPSRSAILLCAGNKAGVSESRFYAKLIKRADRLYDQYIATFGDTRRKDD